MRRFGILVVVVQLLGLSPAVLAASGSAESPVGPLETVTPVFHSLMASPSMAKQNDLILLTFSASEPLAAPPIVTVDGLAADFTESAGFLYTYSFMIAYENPPGLAEILISGQDLMGNAGNYLNGTSLEIGSLPLSLGSGWAALALVAMLVAAATSRSRTSPRVKVTDKPQ